MSDTEVKETVGIKYAVNVADLTTFNEFVHPVNLLLKPVLLRDAGLVDAQPGQLDGMAILVNGATTVERWAAIYDIIRNGMSTHLGTPASELRIYRYKGQGEPPYSVKPSGGVYAGKWEII